MSLLPNAAKEYPDGPKFGFNMATFCTPGKPGQNTGWRGNRKTESCGTVGCIAGWAIFMFGSKEQIDQMISGDTATHYAAANLLGLYCEQGYALFQPHRSAVELRADYESVSPLDAAKAIEHMLEHGMPDWSHVKNRGRA